MNFVFLSFVPLRCHLLMRKKLSLCLPVCLSMYCIYTILCMYRCMYVYDFLVHTPVYSDVYTFCHNIRTKKRKFLLR